MASVRARLLNVAIRAGAAVAFREPFALDQYRRRVERMDRGRSAALPDGIVAHSIAEPIAAAWLKPSRPARGLTLLYLPGGAFMFHLRGLHLGFVADLCARLGASALMPWYRLAPEHPFPCAPRDCLSAYEHLLQSGVRAQDIVLAGDSSGGNLALSLLHLARREGLPMPAGIVALSPITDFAQVSATWLTQRARDPMFRAQALVRPQRYYLNGADVLDPLVSPYYGDFTGFPPLLCMAGGLEALLDDSVSVVRKAIAQGVQAQVQIWQGMPHVFALREWTPEARLARAEIVRWIERRASHALQSEERLTEAVTLINVRAFSGRVERRCNERWT